MRAASTPRPFLAALAASLLFHLLVGTGVPWPLTSPHTFPVSPIEAELVAPASPPEPLAPLTAPPPRPRPVPSPAVASAPIPSPAAPGEETPAVETPAAETAAAETAEPAVTAVDQHKPPAEPSSPPAPDTGPRLPTGFTLRYLVRGADSGFELGQFDHIWQSDGQRYALYAIARATGLMAIVFQGLLSQTSIGAITPQGLRPEQYWMQRGTRQRRVEFHWEAGRAELDGRPPLTELPPGTQDLLSVIYQLTFFPPPEDRLPVLDGKKLTAYELEPLGEEWVEPPLGRTATRRLRLRAGEAEERIELWLRQDYPHLPVQIRFSGRQGNVLLVAESVRGLDRPAESAGAAGRAAD